MSGPPNDANGRVREPMRFWRKGCSASFTTSIGGPLNRIVRNLFIRKPFGNSNRFSMPASRTIKKSYWHGYLHGGCDEKHLRLPGKAVRYQSTNCNREPLARPRRTIWWFAKSMTFQIVRYCYQRHALCIYETPHSGRAHSISLSLQS